MVRTVDELVDSVSHEEILEWAEFYRYHPWPDAKMDAYLANICATLANINRDEKKRSQPFTASDFMLTFTTTGNTEEIDDEDDDDDFDRDDGPTVSPMTIAYLFRKAASTNVH